MPGNAGGSERAFGRVLDRALAWAEREYYASVTRKGLIAVLSRN
jgi:hypothetical protein